MSEAERIKRATPIKRAAPSPPAAPPALTHTEILVNGAAAEATPAPEASEDRERLSRPLGESVLRLLVFGGEKGQVAAERVDPRDFEQPYHDIAKRAINYRKQYGKAPGKEHVDDLFDHVLLDPKNAQAPIYRAILVQLYQHADDEPNDEYVISRLNELKRRQEYKRVTIKMVDRFKKAGHGDDVSLASDLETILYDGLEAGRRHRDDDDGGIPIIDAGENVATPPPREWLLGTTFCRGFMSALIADGAVGKTALRIAQLMALAAGRELTGETVHRRCRVLFVSLEDSLDEVHRRVLAAMKHHNVKHAEIAGWFFYTALAGIGWKIADAKGRAAELERRLRQEIERSEAENRKLDLICLDPFVKAHSSVENANEEMDRVCDIMVGLADRHGVAIDITHHTTKGQAAAGNADAGRGAGAIKNAARLVYTFVPMTPEEARMHSIGEDERVSLRRVDFGKVNLTQASPHARWFRLAGVDLGNSTALYPHGDNVHTVEPYILADVRAGLVPDIADAVLAEIGRGMDNGQRYSAAPKAGDRAAWKVLHARMPDWFEEKCRAIIKKWVASGVLVEREYQDPLDRKSRKGLFLGENRP
jgi:hypothetical protein